MVGLEAPYGWGHGAHLRAFGWGPSREVPENVWVLAISKDQRQHFKRYPEVSRPSISFILQHAKNVMNSLL